MQEVVSVHFKYLEGMIQNYDANESRIARLIAQIDCYGASAVPAASQVVVTCILSTVIAILFKITCCREIESFSQPRLGKAVYG